MKDQHSSIEAAAADATARLGFHVSASDIMALVDLGVLPALDADDGSSPVVRLADSRRLAAQVHTHVQIGGLFDNIPELFPRLSQRRDQAPEGASPAAAPRRGDAIFLGLSPVLGLTFTPDAVPSEVIQLFISLVRAASLQPEGPPPSLLADQRPTSINLDSHAAVWTIGELRADRLRDLWDKAVRREAVTNYSESLATAKIYGNKARLTSFLVGVAGLHVPDGSVICDLMAGTGIVALRLAEHFNVYANDANPFATHLTRCRAASLSDAEAGCTLEAVHSESERNAACLQTLLHELLEAEAGFLHGVVTPESLALYRRFCESFPPPFPAELTPEGVGAAAAPMSANLREMIRERRQDPRSFPYCLATSYYSNAYLGLSQAIAVDSIRYAVDQCTKDASRDLCLGALLLAVSSCGSGPHFAQPPKLHSTKAMQEIVEHRARDLFTEFSMLFRLLATRTPPARSIEQVWCSNWREALAAYDASTSALGGLTRAVYVDAPYTKLQYSRYYHVLNTLLSYDYPPCSGVGRYPPRSDRFSSKFEFQPAAAAREFGDLFDRCADLRLVTLVSYGNRGLVPLGDLVSFLEDRFRAVELYSKPAQHHSQGKPLSKASKSVLEYVLVGLP